MIHYELSGCISGNRGYVPTKPQNVTHCFLYQVSSVAAKLGTRKLSVVYADLHGVYRVTLSTVPSLGSRPHLLHMGHAQQPSYHTSED